jgi:thymidylate synthase
MWNKFLEGGKTFSYTYSERYWEHNQLATVIDTLKGDPGTRQAVLMVWDSNKDMVASKIGGGNRIPCSIGYQFLIRNDRLYCIYQMRSNDFLGHHVIDLWCTAELMKWMVGKLHSTYPKLKVGSLIYQAGSLHAFNWDLKKWVIF